MREALGFFSTFLLVFAAIGLVVACFTIYNTFQIIVTQRRREMALLRSVGATRRQVLWAQLLEACDRRCHRRRRSGSPPASSWPAGLKADDGAASGSTSPLAAPCPAGRTAVVALVVGTVVTTVSAVFPSLRASRAPPLAAVRDLRRHRQEPPRCGG